MDKSINPEIEVGLNVKLGEKDYENVKFNAAKMGKSLKSYIIKVTEANELFNELLDEIEKGIELKCVVVEENINFPFKEFILIGYPGYSNLIYTLINFIKVFKFKKEVYKDIDFKITKLKVYHPKLKAGYNCSIFLTIIRKNHNNKIFGIIDCVGNLSGGAHGHLEIFNKFINEEINPINIEEIEIKNKDHQKFLKFLEKEYIY
ncbi:MAG: hypothetical protein WC413_02635 [Candidatus Nanoarchaeia archaeon]